MNVKKVSRKWWLSIGATIMLVALVWIVSTAMAQEPDGDSSVSPAGGPSLTDTFTYQGRLENDGQPANGNYDFTVEIWDGDDPWGSYVAPCNNHASLDDLNNFPVDDGVFTFHLICDWNSDVFTGDPRWIQVYVREAGSGEPYTTLPRQSITAVPYAWSLRPRAVIKGGVSSPSAVISVTQTYNGPGEDAFGVYGYAPSTGVYGSGGETGVQGYGLRHGVYGLSGVYGVYGESPGVWGTGVYGTGTSIGVRGYSGSGYGVYGATGSNDASGVVGLQSGYSTSDLGGYWHPGGLFGGQNGVVGVTKANFGYAVFGWDKSASNGWAGTFISDNGGGVYISAPAGNTGLIVASGTKNAVVRTDDGSRLLYSEESTEVWFSDYGFGRLRDGATIIPIDPIFAQTVNLEEPYHVFIQVYGDAEVYVTGRTSTQFEVHLREGDANVEFSYRIVAKRLGYEDDRLERATWADNDPNLYPERAADWEAQNGLTEPTSEVSP